MVIESKEGGASITHPLEQPRANQVGIGWLTITFFSRNSGHMEFLKSQVLEIYQYYFMDDFLENERPGRGYRAGVAFRSGTMFNWSTNREDMSLSVTQTAFDSLPVARAMEFLVELTGFDYQVTRLDVYLDDFEQSFSVDFIVQQLEGGWYVGRSQQFATFQGKSLRNGLPTGEIVTIGKRGSSVYLRFYDKQLETNGAYPWNRMELELKKSKAHTAFDVLVHASQELSTGSWPDSETRAVYVANTLKGLLLDCCDFRIPTSATRKTNRRRAEWYERLFMNVAQIPTMSPKKADDIKRVEEWFRECVAPSLAVLYDHFGDQAAVWLEEVIKNGRSRRKPRQKQLLKRESA